MESTEWQARAEREAAAIVNAPGVNAIGASYDHLIRFVAVGWLQGYNVGAHEVLSHNEAAFARLQEELLR